MSETNGPTGPTGPTASTAPTEPAAAIAELNALVAQLLARVQTLEEEAAQRHPEVSENVLLAISAACAAYLGERAKVKQVHLRRGGGWATQGLATVQQQHAQLHGFGERQAPLTQIPRRGTK